MGPTSAARWKSERDANGFLSISLEIRRVNRFVTAVLTSGKVNRIGGQ
jgi:hypothetical protein